MDSALENMARQLSLCDGAGMKIYRTVVAARGLTGEQVNNLRRLDSSLGFALDSEVSIYDHARREKPSWSDKGYDYRAGDWPNCWRKVQGYCLTRRVEFSHDHYIDGKTLARLLPAWAKFKKPANIGPKVTAFYAENDKVITRLHHSGFIVGSDEYHDWTETQPDPFRACRLYRESLGERV